MLTNATALVANLATYEANQVMLKPLLSLISTMLRESQPSYLTVEVARAIANFSFFATNSDVVMRNMSYVISYLTYNGANVNAHAVRCLFNMLRNRRAETINTLCRNGVNDFLARLTEMDNVMNQLSESLAATASPIFH